MNNNNFVVIQGWMCNELKLSGNELLVFALIYGFSQDGESEFSGSRSFIADTFNISKPTVDKAIRTLIDKDLITKHEIVINDIKFNRYKISLGVVKKLYWGGKETLLGGGKETLPNNIIYNNNNNNKDSIGEVRCQQIVDMYNNICLSFPKVTVLSESRKKAIKARLKIYNVDDFKKMFEMAESSSFLKGSNNRNWNATFDWLIKDSNMAKVLDGNYNNKSPKEQKCDDSKLSELERRYLEEW